MNKFDVLFKPITIGSVEIKNRFVMPPMGTNLANGRGFVTEQIISYYSLRAKGGFGLIIIENTSIHPSGKVTPFMLNLYDDKFIPGIKELVAEIQKNGAGTAIQLSHAGRQTLSQVTGKKIVAPSPIPCPVMKEIPRELTKKEIKELIESFGRAAYRAKICGCEAVELHMAHGYLICQFLSPYSNKRKDEYGGNTENRARFALEIIRDIKKKNGDDFPVICRISADEMVQGGISLMDSVVIVQKLVQAGCDAVHVSACNYESSFYNIPCYYLNEGTFIHYSEEIKKTVTIPVIAVGRIRTPEKALEIIINKKADMVSMGRASIADPWLPEKIYTNKEELIRPCLSCNKCFDKIASDKLECDVNYNIYTDIHVITNKNKINKNILIIGAGPAGMEAARIAAQNGCSVTIYEKRNRIGGQLYYAAIPPHKEHFAELITYYENELNRLGVKIFLNKTWDISCRAENPDITIVATGSVPKDFNCLNPKTKKIMLCEEAFENTDSAGNTVIVAGGGPEGAEIADYFSVKNKNVMLIEMKRKIGGNLSASVRFHLEKKLKNQGVTLYTRTEILSINDNSIKVKIKKKEIKEITLFDSVVISLGRVPENSITSDLQKKNVPFVTIGDANRIGDIKNAIYTGNTIFNKILS